MANTSILAAFERMWQHVVAKLGDKANVSDLTSHTSNVSNPHNVTLSQLGVTATAAELNKMDGLKPTTAELNYVDGVTSSIQDQLNAKQATITGAASSIVSSDFSNTDAVLISNSSGKVSSLSGVTKTELQTLKGVDTSSTIQTQLDGKSNTGHTHKYAGSSSAGGAATSANKLNTDAGSATHPVYFANGVPVETTYTLGKSVPSDAKFTDTTYSVATQSAKGLMSANDKKQLDYGGIPIVTTGGTGAAYTATVDGMGALTVGAKLTIIPHTVSTAVAPTLNVNSLGAKAIRMPVTHNTSATVNGAVASWLAANKPVTVQYNGTYWVTIDLPRPSAQYLSGIVPIENGGTGASTAADALTSLGALGNSGDQEITDGSLKITSTGDTALRLDKTIDDSNYVREYMILEADRARLGFGKNGTIGNQISLYEDRTVLTQPLTLASGGTGANTAAGALTNLGITATAAELNKLDGVTATTAELNKLAGLKPSKAELDYVDGVTSNIQDQLDDKQNKITGAASTVVSNDFTNTDTVLVSSSTGKITSTSGVSKTELQTLQGIDTSSTIKEQLAGKVSKSGDTMTGTLDMQHTAMVKGTAPSSGLGRYTRFVDKDSNVMGYNGFYQGTTSSYYQIRANNGLTTTDDYVNLQVGFNASNLPYVMVGNVTVMGAGTTGNVRNIQVQNSAGTTVSTGRIIMKRK